MMNLQNEIRICHKNFMINAVEHNLSLSQNTSISCYTQICIMYKAMHRSSYRLYILGLLSKHHAPHTCLRHISLCTFHCTSLRNKQFLIFYQERCEMGELKFIYSGYGHTSLVTQPMLQLRPNCTELRSMDYYHQMFCRF